MKGESMTKKQFIALADSIREHNRSALCNQASLRDHSRCTTQDYTPSAAYMLFTQGQLSTLANFCQSQNPRFNRKRWLSYIAGECGQSGGTNAK
jgi:hypothetical protein